MPQNRDKILTDLKAYEPLLRARADHEIVTTVPVAEIVDALERIAEDGLSKTLRPPPRPEQPDELAHQARSSDINTNDAFNTWLASAPCISPPQPCIWWLRRRAV